jgi:hypothetical protein
VQRAAGSERVQKNAPRWLGAGRCFCLVVDEDTGGVIHGGGVVARPALPGLGVSAGGGERVVHVGADVTLSVARRGVVVARVDDARDTDEVHEVLDSVGVMGGFGVAI